MAMQVGLIEGEGVPFFTKIASGTLRYEHETQCLGTKISHNFGSPAKAFLLWCTEYDSLTPASSAPPNTLIRECFLDINAEKTTRYNASETHAVTYFNSNGAYTGRGNGYIAYAGNYDNYIVIQGYSATLFFAPNIDYHWIALA